MPVAPKTSVGFTPTAVSTVSMPNEFSEAVNWLNFAWELGNDVMKVVELSRSKKTVGTASAGRAEAPSETSPKAKTANRGKLHFIRRHLKLLHGITRRSAVEQSQRHAVAGGRTAGIGRK